MNKVLRLTAATSLACLTIVALSSSASPVRAADQPAAPKAAAIVGTVIEAESGKIDGGATVQGDNAASGGNVVGSFHLQGASLLLAKVDGAKGGQFKLSVTYAAPNDTSNTMYVNDVKVGSVDYPSSGGWFGPGMYKDKVVAVTLKAGAVNTLKLVTEDGNNAINIDKITVIAAPPPAPK